MTGVYQTRRDNCVAACVATLFDIPLDAVPEMQPQTWAEQLGAWLAERGFGMVHLRLDDDSPPGSPMGLTLGEVATQNPDFPPHYTHCVVCQDGAVVWCPVRGTQPGDEVVRTHTLIYALHPRLPDSAHP